MRAEPGFDLAYRVVGQEPLIVLMPSDHPLARRKAVSPRDLVGHPYIAMANKASVLRAVVDDYLERSGVTLVPTQGVDNPAMAVSLVASTRGLALIPAYVKNLLPWSVVARPLAGAAPTIALAIGYSKSNASALLKTFVSRLDEAGARTGQ
jgi:LysR family hca operon transcriptional activator